ncbi:hypothetical protein PIB30_078320 [Stylosanthes scabra]|uniref:Uncharacterized protein n=1 Tax=Stylosanthes scabra TaxID=79078 RepID=A0ABU6XQB6_9FABA|nr:hypothetical protein [Stylosanthes scabra]
MAEVFKQTHTLKANKEQFTDKRSADIWDEFTNNTAVATQQAAESGTNAEVDLDLSSSVSLTSPAPAGPEEAVDLREQVQLLNQNIQDMARQLHESEERIQALHDELTRRPEEHRRQMGVTGEQMRVGSSSAAQVPPAHPPAPSEDDDADYVDP